MRLIIPFLAGLMLALSACAGSIPTPAPQPSATNPPAPTATPVVMTRQDPSQSKIPLTTACKLITTHDVAAFFAAEVDQPLYQANAVAQVIFSSERVSADESYCIYNAFHNPGSATGTTYQFTYWVDTPAQATPDEWAKVWTEAKSKAARPISGIGEDAFYNQGRLTFKKASTYVTIEVLSTRIDTETTEGVNQQMDIEKTIALKALSRME